MTEKLENCRNFKIFEYLLGQNNEEITENIDEVQEKQN